MVTEVVDLKSKAARARCIRHGYIRAVVSI